MALTDAQVADLEQVKVDIQDWLAEEQAEIDEQVAYLERLPANELTSKAETAALDAAVALLENLLSSE